MTGAATTPLEVTATATRSHLVHAATMLRSLGTATPRRVHVHLLHGDDVRPDDLEPVRASLADLDVDVSGVPVPSSLADGLPRHRFHVSAWFRVLLPELAPALDRVLHLDVDTIVIDDLGPLWEHDLGECLFAAVLNPLYPFQPPHHRDVLGLDGAREYPNSGVLLMDLERMRQEQLPDRLRSYAAAHPDNHWPEQDALAVVARGRWRQLPPRWNVQPTCYDLDPTDLPWSSDALAEALADPAVIHFLGPYKPWTPACRHPLRHLYHHVRSGTVYPPAAPPVTWRDRLLRRLDEPARARLVLAEARTRGLLRRLRRRR